METYLGEFEQLVLLALLRLGDKAYGVTVRQEITRRTARSVTLGAIYKSLSRLEHKGYVSSWEGDPTPERGGRRKRYYRIEPAGNAALERSFAALRNMRRGLRKGLEPI